jgi:hypothetical protein
LIELAKQLRVIDDLWSTTDAELHDGGTFEA